MDRTPEPLVIGTVIREDEGDILEGLLRCPIKRCRREHPIIDGVAIIVPDIRRYMTTQLAAVRARDDLSLAIESVLGDCAGAGSEMDNTRYQLSTYARGHYGDLDPDQPVTTTESLVAVLESAVGLLPAPPAGTWIDVGCSVGRSTFELAAKTDLPTLGVDINFAMLQMAKRVARTGRIVHPLRRVGMVYDRREFEVDVPARSKVDFWACDAMALPFADDSVDGLLSLNLIDCTEVPLQHLTELARVLRTDAHALITSPYDWSGGTTPIENWIGGHSQQADTGGSSAETVRQILTTHNQDVGLHMVLAAETDGVPWRVYVHEREDVIYKLHIVAARAISSDD